MSVGLDHPAVAAYLARLDAAAAVLPPGRREELITEIRGHLRDSLADAGDPDDATVLGVLDRLGDPEGIVAAEAIEGLPTARRAGMAPAVPGTAPAPAAPGGWGPLEILAVLGLTVGAFLLPIFGPLIGIACAWFSARWTRGEKLVATVLVFLPAAVLTLGALSLVTVGRSATGVSVPVTVVTGTPSPVPSGGPP